MTEDLGVRRRTMQAVRSTDTKPEKTVRQIVSHLGYRYRLHRQDLPGTPDLAFIGKRKVIFVNGCFWHGHDCARGARVPKTNTEYWLKKVAGNKARDFVNVEKLSTLGWQSLVVWECELNQPSMVSRALAKFLR